MVGGGHAGYAIVCTFAQQIAEAKKASYPVRFCRTLLSMQREHVDHSGSPCVTAVHGNLSSWGQEGNNYHQQCPMSECKCSDIDRHLGDNCSNHEDQQGYHSNEFQLQRKRRATRHYWTQFDLFGDVYRQAVRRMSNLSRDDMFRYVTEIGTRGCSLCI